MLSFQSMPVPFAIASAAIAYLVYRRFARTGGVDLCSEVFTERESLHSVVEALPEQLDLAKRSRLAVAQGRGLLASDAIAQWLRELAADLKEAQLLAAQVPSADTGSAEGPSVMEAEGPSVMELDLKLVEILALSIRANRLADKYRLSLSADAADAERLLLEARSVPEPSPVLQPSMPLTVR